MVFEKIFCSKLSKNHSEFEKRKKKDFSLPDSRIEKSHQIEPIHRFDQPTEVILLVCLLNDEKGRINYINKRGHNC